MLFDSDSLSIMVDVGVRAALYVSRGCTAASDPGGARRDGIDSLTGKRMQSRAQGVASAPAECVSTCARACQKAAMARERGWCRRRQCPEAEACEGREIASCSRDYGRAALATKQTGMSGGREREGEQEFFGDEGMPSLI